MKKVKERYKPGQHPQYEHFLAHYRAISAVLNPGRSPRNEEAWAMSDKRGLMRLLAEYKAKLANCLALVDGVGEAFEEHKLRFRRQGKREPKELTPELAEMKFKFEAWADVIQEEIGRIKELLAKFTDMEKQEEESRILMYGPMGTSRGEPTIEIDCQPCIQDKDGYPVIDCPKSPYHGMLVVDYREHVSRPWREATADRAAAALKKSHDLTLPKEERERLFAESHYGGKPVPWGELPLRPEGY